MQDNAFQKNQISFPDIFINLSETGAFDFSQFSPGKLALQRYKELTDFASKTPKNNTGVYYYEARDAVAVAATNIISGADIDAELKTVDDTVNFAMSR